MFNPMPPEKGQLEQSGHALSKAGSAGRRALCKWGASEKGVKKDKTIQNGQKKI